jgi:hypothetical protein
MKLSRFLRRPILAYMPPGMTADSSAAFGLIALLANANAYCGHLTSDATSGTNYAVPANTCRRRVLYLTSGAGGGFTITLPTTAAIISALNNEGGNTIPTDGTYGQLFSIVNVNIGQTGTLTAGDASTTITGTATIATNTRRDFFLMVTAATTVTYYNIGSATL